MRCISIGVIAALLLQITSVLCMAQESVMVGGIEFDQNRDASSRVTQNRVVIPVVEIDQNRMVQQFLGGFLASGVAIAGTVALHLELYDDESILLVFGTPLVFLVSNSYTVYYIGKHFDKTAHGSYWATLGGTLGGLLASGGIASIIGLNTEIDTQGWIVGLSSVWVFSTVGSVVGYNLSRPKVSAVLNIQDRHIQWGVPVPTLNMSRLLNNHVEANYTLCLVNVRF